MQVALLLEDIRLAQMAIPITNLVIAYSEITQLQAPVGRSTLLATQSMEQTQVEVHGLAVISVEKRIVSNNISSKNRAKEISTFSLALIILISSFLKAQK